MPRRILVLFFYNIVAGVHVLIVMLDLFGKRGRPWPMAKPEGMTFRQALWRVVGLNNPWRGTVLAEQCLGESPGGWASSGRLNFQRVIEYLIVMIVVVITRLTPFSSSLQGLRPPTCVPFPPTRPSERPAVRRRSEPPPRWVPSRQALRRNERLKQELLGDPARLSPTGSGVVVQPFPDRSDGAELGTSPWWAKTGNPI